MTAQKELNKETNKTLLNTTMTNDGNCSKTGRMFSDFKKPIIRASPPLRDLLFGNKRGLLELKVMIQIWFLLEHRNKLRSYSYPVIEWNFQWQYYQEQMVRVLYTYFNTQRIIQTFFLETLERSGNPQKCPLFGNFRQTLFHRDISNLNNCFSNTFQRADNNQMFIPNFTDLSPWFEIFSAKWYTRERIKKTLEKLILWRMRMILAVFSAT